MLAAMLARRFGLSLKDAWDTSLDEMHLLVTYDEQVKKGPKGKRLDRTWAEKVKERLRGNSGSEPERTDNGKR